MRFSAIHSALLGSTALVGALALSIGPAQAQMYSTGPGTYVSAEGRYMWNAGSEAQNYARSSGFPPFSGFVPYDTSKAAADKGWGGKLMLGYRFTNNWDVGLGVGGGWLKGKDDTFTTNFVPELQESLLPPNAAVDKISTKMHFVTVDFEAGYNMPIGSQSTFRLFGGLRFADTDQTAKGTVDHIRVVGRYYYYSGKRKTTFTGVGPRIGINGSLGLGGGFNVFGGLSGSLLIGRYRDRHSYSYTNSLNDNVGAGGANDSKKTKIVPNPEGEIGLGYNFIGGSGTTVGLQLGYRGEAFFGTATKGHINGSDVPEKSNGNYLTHGPFVRLVATFGSAAPMPMASPPPAQPPMNVKSFIVFFDFDKSNITSEAQKTINDAVSAAKAGGSSRVTLTGHTDRSGSEQYNMALSLRRAEAVKANMIKQGVPASAIVVIGKGESSPLVPTADGVREPQNRRVEIVI